MKNKNFLDQQICSKTVNSLTIFLQNQARRFIFMKLLTNRYALSENWQLTAMHTWYADKFKTDLGTKMWPLQGILLREEREDCMECTKAGIKIPQTLKAGSSQSSEAVFGYQPQGAGGLSILKKEQFKWWLTGLHGHTLARQICLFKYTFAPWKCEQKPLKKHINLRSGYGHFII